MEQIKNHPALDGLLTDLQNHAMLTSAGLDSEQASHVVFNKLRPSNEDSQQEIWMRSNVSECHRAEVRYAGLYAYCTRCGEHCNSVPNEGI